MSNATRPRWFLTLEPTATELNRFWSKVERQGDADCWPWTGALNRSTGYGTFALRETSTPSHRASYLIANGEIREGMVLDHLCRNRGCVNPAHLEPVTPKTNSRRSPLVYKTECSNGHPYDEHAVTYERQRDCRVCRNERSKVNQRRYRAAQRAAG